LDWLQENSSWLGSLSETDSSRRECAGELRHALKICEEYVELLESSMAKLAKAYDGLADHSEEEDKQFEKYMESSQETIMKLHRQKPKLEIILHKDVTGSTKHEEEHAMEKRIKEENESEWSLDQWLNAIDQTITQEELLKDMLPKDFERQRSSSTRDSWKGSASCEYCQQRGHKWNSCPGIPNATVRKSFLMKKNRCLNCGSASHRVSSCPGGNCRKCAGRHHTAICSKGVIPIKEQEMRSGGDSLRPREQKSRILSSGTSTIKKPTTEKRPQRSSRQHAVTSEISQPENPPANEAVVLHLNENLHDTKENRQKVILLAGSANVLDSKGMMRSVTILLDTGSELSFIDDRLAQELGLPTVDRSSLLISTFGSNTPSAKECDIMMIKLCDIEGVQHEVRLHKNDFITGTIEKANLDQSDLDFINKQKIVLSMPMKQKFLQPQILLGCDYLWNFMVPMGRLVLPSGLLLIPTRFGYIISATFYKELDRHVLKENTTHRLFAFSDASQFAIATCVYIASTGNSHLVMAKSKLPSLKTSITIPKQEMNALTLSARVALFICKELEPLCKLEEVIFFSDSEIVLGWAKSPPARKSVGILVSNRLKELADIVEDLKSRGISSRFGYVSTAENPADCGTRGLSSDALQDHYWWNGPPIIRNFDTTRSEDNFFPLSSPKIEKEEEAIPPAVVASLTTKQEKLQNEATLLNLTRFITLHDHLVKWRIFDGIETNVLETTCRATPFCTQVDCTFCVATIANPECWPRTAIFLTGLSIYMFVTLCYFLFHVPVIIGNPLLYLLRTIGRIGFLITKSTLKFLSNPYRM
uniref:DUF1758 domain-containing protein n=1 Tax=Heligmosomoides polygyrus TaxID=6339 RepID=A0A183FMF8_HELPZ